LQERTPSLVLLDIDLPDGSGWEVLRALRAGGHYDVGVIVMSALPPNPRLIEELGCVAGLEKPFPMDSLLRLVSQVCMPSGEPAPQVESESIW
jgi:DNA-binding response OmpR family regulator